MPYSIECFLEIHKNMEEVLLVLEVPLAQYSQAENLFSCTGFPKKKKKKKKVSGASQERN